MFSNRLTFSRSFKAFKTRTTLAAKRFHCKPAQRLFTFNRLRFPSNLKYRIPIVTLSVVHFTSPSSQTDSYNMTQQKSENITPIKSDNDKRTYRLLTLSNAMRCVLISDPETDKSAAALDVHVGHFGDPDEIPGLAHFCEHMLFLGTKKYPDEAEYNKFLKEHGGSSNASTGMHDTCFQFDVSKDHLEAALDRFSEFFISPLFTKKK